MEKVWRRVRGGPVATLLLGLASLVVAACPGATALLEFDRAALARGEAWRSVTGHVTHYSLEHLAYDLLALLVLGIACELRAPRRTRAVLAASGFGVTAAVLYLAPDVERYRGLSGLDSALFTLLIVDMLRAPRSTERIPRWIPTVAGTLFLAKLAFEGLGHGNAFVDAGSLFRAVPVAHAAGALIGLVGGLARQPSARGTPSVSARASRAPQQAHRSP